MANGFIQVPPQSTGEKVAVKTLSNGSVLVDRQEIVLTDGADFAAVADVKNVAPGATDYGLVVRPLSPGSSVYHKVAAVGPNAASILGLPGRVTGWTIFNNTGIPIYVKLHDTAGVPTPGTGVVYTIGVQAGFPEHFSGEISFSTGIGITIVEGIQDSDVTPVQADTCVVNVHYSQ